MVFPRWFSRLLSSSFKFLVTRYIGGLLQSTHNDVLPCDREIIHHVMENVRYFISGSVVVPVTSSTRMVSSYRIIPTNMPLERKESIARANRYQKSLLP